MSAGPDGPGPLFSVPTMFPLLAMALGSGGGQLLRPLGWPGSAPAPARAPRSLLICHPPGAVALSP